MVMKNIPEESYVSRGGGGGRYTIDQKPLLIKKLYHKVN